MGKLEEDFEINSPAEKFYKRWSYEVHHLPEASPDKVQGAEIHEGDWVTPGSVKLWNYTVDSSLSSIKAYKIVNQVFPKDEAGTVKITLIYEKFKETDGEPHDYLRFLVDLAKDLDKHLIPKQG
ncbi:MLP-like protein 28 [Eucalyptus grandis]|uniref:MLP-like protein 28 n=1 Tax=Eucalyptus grandis TaxID=71139 RepID=UPI0008A0CD76|nr:MLP-like protein 28 [Eucalyptus grandis]